MIIDLRCPRCNRPVSSRNPNDDVVIRKRLPRPCSVCVHCQAPVRIVTSPPEPGFQNVQSFHYTTTS